MNVDDYMIKVSILITVLALGRGLALYQKYEVSRFFILIFNSNNCINSNWQWCFEGYTRVYNMYLFIFVLSYVYFVKIMYIHDYTLLYSRLPRKIIKIKVKKYSDLAGGAGLCFGWVT